jgi:glutaminyl-tRNA synthetase
LAEGTRAEGALAEDALRSAIARERGKMAVDDTTSVEAGRDFIRDIVQADLDSGRHKTIVTRFPPEPNGYLHIGHAKSIGLNFGIAQEFGGRCHLRFDDTNPVKEEQEYIDAIKEDVRWLGCDWGQHLYYASDYFEQLYEWAERLIKAGKAYVDDQSPDEMRAARGTLTEPGKNSPFRDRSVEENLDLFRRMRAGEFPNGARVLRARIDMASGNINLRDPVLYRILHAHHPRTGDAWKIYPSYDYAHGQSDAIEHITHSICTLEFEDHRPLYDWLIENLPVPSRPHQYEFARLNLSYTILSKRVLTRLVQDGHVSGWDDPRMPTLAGLRRRGVPPSALRDFVKRIGVAKANSVVDVAMLDFSIREALNKTALRRMAVLRPLKVVIENYPDGQSEELEAVNHPDDPSAGTRKIRFGREIYIEQDDFMENPPKKFFRLSPGSEVRLRYAYFITCREVKKNAAGEVVELRCTYDPATKGGNAPDGRKVKATIHWVSAQDAVSAEVRLYNPLFTKPDPDAANFAAELNPNSLEVLPDARLEPAIIADNSSTPMQFERQGYFVRDRDSTPGRPVFSRTIGLRDTWAKVSAGA